MIEPHEIDRLLRNILDNVFASRIPTPAEHIASYCEGEWELDIKDVSTAMRIMSGEASRMVHDAR